MAGIKRKEKHCPICGRTKPLKVFPANKPYCSNCKGKAERNQWLKR